MGKLDSKLVPDEVGERRKRRKDLDSYVDAGIDGIVSADDTSSHHSHTGGGHDSGGHGSHSCSSHSCGGHSCGGHGCGGH
jgi:hypothetical protein